MALDRVFIPKDLQFNEFHLKQNLHWQSCLVCIHKYYSVIDSITQEPTTNQQYTSIIEQYNTNRQTATLVSIILNAHEEKVDLNKARLDASPVLYEILKYADLTKHHNLCITLITTIHALQADGLSLKPPDTHFPGNQK